MTPDSETAAALRRAGRRAVYHLLKAAVEGLKAVEAVVDELGRVGKSSTEEPPTRSERIEVE